MTVSATTLRRPNYFVLGVALSLGAVAGSSLAARDDARRVTTTVLAVSPPSSTLGQTVTLTATVAPRGGDDRPAGSVEYFAGPRPLGTSALANEGDVVASLQVRSLPPGPHQITARYLGHPSFLPSASLPVQHVVNPQQ